MNSRGNLGQIFTSIPAMILIFVIMIIFVIISGAIGKGISEKKEAPESSIDSVVLLDVILNSSVPIKEVGVSGFSSDEGDVTLGALINIASKVEPARHEIILKSLQNHFDKFYSCGKQNKMMLIYFDGSSGSGRIKRTLIDYPSTFDKPVFPIEIKPWSKDNERLLFCNYHNLSPGASRILWSADDRIYACVYVEAVVSC